MIKLIDLLRETFIKEGGNVFKNSEYDSQDILSTNIESTVKKFVEDFGSSKLFPNKKSTFAELTNKDNWLGSTSKKTQSGDIDLAYSSKHFFKDGKVKDGEIDLEGWSIDENEFNTLYEKYRKSSPKATNEAVQIRALLDSIINKVNKAGGDMFGSNKATNGGTLHFSYPQYTPTGEKVKDPITQKDLRAQLDIDTGDMDWLKFRYNSELPNIENSDVKQVEKAADDYYKKGIRDLEELSKKYNIDIEDLKRGLIKGLHRGQLMLAMFAATGYTFKSGKGFIRKETGEIIADTPQNALEVFNKEYQPKQPLTPEINNNYNKLMNYIKTNLKPEDKIKALDLFKEALRRADAYVPDNI
jgi:hypothetical protein